MIHLKKRKTISTLATVLTFSILLQGGFTDVMASELAQKSNERLSSTKTENMLIDPEDIFTNMLDAIANSKVTNDPYQFSTRNSIGSITTYSDYIVKADGNPTITNESSLFVGESILTNDTDKEQILKSNSFSKTISNTVSSQVTNGFMLGTEASASFGIPLIGSTEVTLKAEYNYSDTETKETSESYTYGVEPQEISVPPHSSVKVNVELNTANISGKVKLNASPNTEFEDVEGLFHYGTSESNITSSLPFTYNWNTLTKEIKQSNIPIEYVDYDFNENMPKLVGTGTYEAEYGTTFKVSVSPVVEKGFTYHYTTIPKVIKN